MQHFYDDSFIKELDQSGYIGQPVQVVGQAAALSLTVRVFLHR